MWTCCSFNDHFPQSQQSRPSCCQDIGGDAANTISGIFDDEIPHDDEEVVVPREREKKDKKKKKDKKDKKDKTDKKDKDT